MINRQPLPQPLPSPFYSLCYNVRKPVAGFAQVFEVDKALLQQHALPLLATYKYSEPYMLRALRMDEHLPFPGNS